MHVQKHNGDPWYRCAPFRLPHFCVTTIKDDYKAYYPIIGCRAFDVVELYEEQGKSVDCFVDDEGMINGSPVNEYWLRAYHLGLVYNPLFGICVITMTDRNTGDIPQKQI